MSSSYMHDIDAELGTFGILKFFSIVKNFFAIFYQVNNLFMHQSYLKAHSESN